MNDPPAEVRGRVVVLAPMSLEAAHLAFRAMPRELGAALATPADRDALAAADRACAMAISQVERPAQPVAHAVLLRGEPYARLALTTSQRTLALETVEDAAGSLLRRAFAWPEVAGVVIGLGGRWALWSGVLQRMGFEWMDAPQENLLGEVALIMRRRTFARTRPWGLGVASDARGERS